MTMQMFMRCGKCCAELTHKAFDADRSKARGYAYDCKHCRRARQATLARTQRESLRTADRKLARSRQRAEEAYA